MKHLLAGLALLLMPAIGFAQTEVSAVTKFSRVIEMRAEIGGTVAWVGVTEGTQVAEGDVLLRLDDRLQQSRVEVSRVIAGSKGPTNRAKAQLLQAQNRLKRVERAAARGGAPKYEVIDARSAVEVARAEYASAQELEKSNIARLQMEEATLAQSVITAPFSGTIVEVNAEPGVLAGGDKPLLVLADQSEIEIVAFINVADAEAIKQQGSVEANFEAPVNQTVRAQLRFLDPRIEPSSGTIRGLFIVDNRDLKAPSGVRVRITIPNGS